MKISLGLGVVDSLITSSVATLVEVAASAFDFLLDSLTRGNLDNDELG